MMSSHVGQEALVADESSSKVHPDNNNNLLFGETLKNRETDSGNEHCLITTHPNNQSYSETNASGKDPKKKKKKKSSCTALSDHLVKDADAKNKNVVGGGGSQMSTIMETSVSSSESSLALEERMKTSSKLIAMTATDTKRKGRRSSATSTSASSNSGTSASSKSKKKKTSEVKKKSSRRKKREDAALINTLRNALPPDSRLAKSFENPAFHANFLKWLINDQRAEYATKIVDPSAATEKINNTAVNLTEQTPLVGLSEVTPIMNNLTSARMDRTTQLSSLSMDIDHDAASMASEQLPLLFSTKAALAKPKQTTISLKRDGSSSPENVKATNKAETTFEYDVMSSSAGSIDEEFASYPPPPSCQNSSVDVSPATWNSSIGFEGTTLELDQKVMSSSAGSIHEEFASYPPPPSCQNSSVDVSPATWNSSIGFEGTTLELDQNATINSFMQWLVNHPTLPNVQGNAPSSQARTSGPNQTSVLPPTPVPALIACPETCMDAAHPQPSPERSPTSSSERVLINETPDTSEDYVHSLKEQWLAGGAPLTQVPFRSSQGSLVSELSDLASVIQLRRPLIVDDQEEEDDDDSSSSTSSSSENEEWTDGNTDNEQNLETRFHHQPPFLGSYGQSRKTSLVTTDVDNITKNVSFSTVHVRRYSTILGDNPSCTNGPSLSIGWEYEDEGAFDVDGYDRAVPSSPADLLFSREERESILTRLGYSNKEMTDSIRLLIKSKNQRRQTVNNLRAEGFETILQSARRKVKRVLIPSGQR